MGLLLLLPFFLLRFGLLRLLDKSAIARAAHFAPMEEGEQAAYWLYQAANAAIFIRLLFVWALPSPALLFYAGLPVYAAGLVLLALSAYGFAQPAASGVLQKGVYKLSRNPMYLAYYLFFLGCVMLTGSLLLLGFVLLFVLCSHRIILAEERWCLHAFGGEYAAYMQRVRRYI